MVPGAGPEDQRRVMTQPLVEEGVDFVAVGVGWERKSESGDDIQK